MSTAVPTDTAPRRAAGLAAHAAAGLAALMLAACASKPVPPAPIPAPAPAPAAARAPAATAPTARAARGPAVARAPAAPKGKAGVPVAPSAATTPGTAAPAVAMAPAPAAPAAAPAASADVARAAPAMAEPPAPATAPTTTAATSPSSIAAPPAPMAAPAAAAAPARDAEPPPPPDLERVPDASPQAEPILPGGPNKPYEVGGQSYVPKTTDEPFVERGIASWYGRKFHGRRTASGELYNMYAMTAAHKTLPIPSYARVRNPKNGNEIVVRINDRGPFVKGRIVDLSYAAAMKLGTAGGVAPVELERITLDDIRTGAWRRDGATAVALAPPSAEPATVITPAAATSAAPTAAATPVAATLADEPRAVAPSAASPPPASPAGAEPPPADAALASAQRAYTAPARGFWVQLGAFNERHGAETFHRRVSDAHDWLAPMLAMFVDLPLFRLQAGPYPSRDAARNAAEQIRAALRLVPVILERR